MKHPKKIALSQNEVDHFHATIQTLDSDGSIKTPMTGLLDNHLWLHYQLQENKMSMSQLRAYFGIKSENTPK